MPIGQLTAGQIAENVRALLNDTAGAVYTFPIIRPYLNMALDDLQQTLELNNVPVTNTTTSPAIAVDAGVTSISFSTTPALPQNLIDIRQLWESPRDQNLWIPMKRVDFLPHYLEDQMAINQLLYFSFNEEAVQFIAANADNDIKIDYIRSLFTILTDNDEGVLVGPINCDCYLYFYTASLCARYIGENEARSMALKEEAQNSIDTILGISSKGRQAITTRRRPFRAGYKSLGWW